MWPDIFITPLTLHGPTIARSEGWAGQRRSGSGHQINRHFFHSYLVHFSLRATFHALQLSKCRQRRLHYCNINRKFIFAQKNQEANSFHQIASIGMAACQVLRMTFHLCFVHTIYWQYTEVDAGNGKHAVLIESLDQVSDILKVCHNRSAWNAFWPDQVSFLQYHSIQLDPHLHKNFDFTSVSSDLHLERDEDAYTHRLRHLHCLGYSNTIHINFVVHPYLSLLGRSQSDSRKMYWSYYVSHVFYVNHFNITHMS
jgi:hypothetical protein